MNTIAVLLLAPFFVVANGENIFFQLAKQHKNIYPDCNVPVTSKPHPFVNYEHMWGNLTQNEQRSVIKCHSTFEPECYNGFFKFENRGYSRASIEAICNSYRTEWKPCCDGSDPRLWAGPLRAYCPLYMGNCPGLTEGQSTNSGSQVDYSQYFVTGEDKFNTMCPGFDGQCASNPTMKDATYFVDTCYSLSVYRGTTDCDAKYGASPLVHRVAGCKKYKQYCEPLQN